MKVIPIFASAGITGFESPASEYTQLALDLDEILIQHPSATFIGQACGDSMQGVGIFDHDFLIVDRHVQPLNGDVVVANYNGEFVCKILDTVNRQLLSANTGFAPVHVSEADSFSLEGVVVHSIRNHRAREFPFSQ
ncbi:MULTISPECIES: LexA family transcriptional regulator [unclassified Vibrio]|uniref:LexA family protein n=1 Tax=Vibrio sp. HB236076 TaxID=3232307 RepID=A0AB39HLH4_9VIBR|nr:translesion error-prone DNA polymerase V autoproteolytic subunit [Vibrio sp. HB161653]MDP5253010.1 translesion error-prone DNA polymerase V autoproteolytic subunit [Vibrio sp. HB161653]